MYADCDLVYIHTLSNECFGNSCTGKLSFSPKGGGADWVVVRKHVTYVAIHKKFTTWAVIFICVTKFMHSCTSLLPYAFLKYYSTDMHCGINLYNMHVMVFTILKVINNFALIAYKLGDVRVHNKMIF